MSDLNRTGIDNESDRNQYCSQIQKALDAAVQAYQLVAAASVSELDPGSALLSQQQLDDLFRFVFNQFMSSLRLEQSAALAAVFAAESALRELHAQVSEPRSRLAQVKEDLAHFLKSELSQPLVVDGSCAEVLVCRNNVLSPFRYRDFAGGGFLNRPLGDLALLLSGAELALYVTFEDLLLLTLAAEIVESDALESERSSLMQFIGCVHPSQLKGHVSEQQELYLVLSSPSGEFRVSLASLLSMARQAVI